MARGRFLNTSIAEDIELNGLSLEAHWLYMMTIPHLDRDGLIKADTYVFFGKVCPRRPELIPRVDALIDEWAKCGLVTLYPTRDGKVAFFHGFTKNQQGMHYSREGASALDVPPGYMRTPMGLLTIEEAETQNNAKNGDDTPSEPTPDSLPTNSRPNPTEVKVEVKSQVEVKAEIEAESERAAPPAAAVDPSIARLWAKWDANMPGAKTEVIVDSVNALLDDYSVAEIEEAINIACKRNKRYLSYVEGILARGAFSQAPPTNGNGYMSKGERQQAEVEKAFALLEERGMPLH
jgi:hypothetical protein